MPGGSSATSNTAHRRKKCIFFTGRVHPGEPQVSETRLGCAPSIKPAFSSTLWPILALPQPQACHQP